MSNPGRPRITVAPRIFALDDFASEAEVEHLLRVTGDLRAMRARGVEVNEDGTGTSFELPVAGDAVAEALCARIHALVGFENDHGESLRYRRYAVGESHPLHGDTYEIEGSTLVATAVLCLRAPSRGGETLFPHAQPEPLAQTHRRGRLVLWFNHDLAGDEDPASAHEGLEILDGEKITLTAFLYKDLDAFVARYEPHEAPAPSARAVAEPVATFVCVTDVTVPEETTRLLREACEARDVAYVEVNARDFDYRPEYQLAGDELMYRPAVSSAAARVEQWLYAEGVATFYADPAGPFFEHTSPELLFQRAGLPIPRTHWVTSSERERLRAQVEDVGGFPVVLKFPGGEGGVGVVRADSWPGLFSLVDWALAEGRAPTLSAFVDDAVHWRLVVVGDAVVASYRSRNAPDDFRSEASDDEDDYLVAPPDEMKALAVAAVAETRLELGGVDVLAHPSGRHYLLEANFPCYFPQAQLATGVDVAGAIVEHLLEKRRLLHGG